MDQFDLTKPLCIFILDLNPDPETSAPPEDIIQEYVDNRDEGVSDITDGPDEASDTFPVPCPAIRGSTLPFGGWGRPKKSVKISSEHYALVVNNPIPPGTEYKWLDMSGKGIPGDIDPHTRYSYEPQPYKDRPVTFRTPQPGTELAIVMDRWGNYNSRIIYTKLEKWIAHENFEGALVNLNIEQDNIETDITIELEKPTHDGVLSSMPEVCESHFKQSLSSDDGKQSKLFQHGHENVSTENVVLSMKEETSILKNVKFDKVKQQTSLQSDQETFVNQQPGSEAKCTTPGDNSVQYNDQVDSNKEQTSEIDDENIKYTQVENVTEIVTICETKNITLLDKKQTTAGEVLKDSLVNVSEGGNKSSIFNNTSSMSQITTTKLYNKTHEKDDEVVDRTDITDTLLSEGTKDIISKTVVKTLLMTEKTTPHYTDVPGTNEQIDLIKSEDSSGNTSLQMLMDTKLTQVNVGSVVNNDKLNGENMDKLDKMDSKVEVNDMEKTITRDVINGNKLNDMDNKVETEKRQLENNMGTVNVEQTGQLDRTKIHDNITVEKSSSEVISLSLEHQINTIASLPLENTKIDSHKEDDAEVMLQPSHSSGSDPLSNANDVNISEGKTQTNSDDALATATREMAEEVNVNENKQGYSQTKSTERHRSKGKMDAKTAESIAKSLSGGAKRATIKNTSHEKTKSKSPEKSKSTSPEKSKSTFPEKSKSTSPEKSKSTSPEKSKSTSPEKSKSTSPEKSKSTSPEKSKSTSPEKSKSTSPEKSKSTSPEKSKSISTEKTKGKVIKKDIMDKGTKTKESPRKTTPLKEESTVRHGPKVRDDAKGVKSSSKTSTPTRPKSFSATGTTPVRKYRPFSSLSSDMKFSRIRRSTEEIFIEKTPPKNKANKDSSGSDSDGFLATPTRSGSASPMDPSSSGDDVFASKRTIIEENVEESAIKEDQLSKVVLKDVFSDMMSKARKFSDDFMSKHTSSYTRYDIHTTYKSNQARGYSQRSTVTPDRYQPKPTYQKGPRAAKSMSSLYDPSFMTSESIQQTPNSSKSKIIQHTTQYKVTTQRLNDDGRSMASNGKTINSMEQFNSETTHTLHSPKREPVLDVAATEKVDKVSTKGVKDGESRVEPKIIDKGAPDVLNNEKREFDLNLTSKHTEADDPTERREHVKLSTEIIQHEDQQNETSVTDGNIGTLQIDKTIPHEEGNKDKPIDVSITTGINISHTSESANQIQEDKIHIDGSESRVLNSALSEQDATNNKVIDNNLDENECLETFNSKNGYKDRPDNETSTVDVQGHIGETFQNTTVHTQECTPETAFSTDTISSSKHDKEFNNKINEQRENWPSNDNEVKEIETKLEGIKTNIEETVPTNSYTTETKALINNVTGLVEEEFAKDQEIKVNKISFDLDDADENIIKKTNIVRKSDEKIVMMPKSLPKLSKKDVKSNKSLKENAVDTEFQGKSPETNSNATIGEKLKDDAQDSTAEKYSGDKRTPEQDRSANPVILNDKVSSQDDVLKCTNLELPDIEMFVESDKMQTISDEKEGKVIFHDDLKKVKNSDELSDIEVTKSENVNLTKEVDESTEDGVKENKEDISLQQPDVFIAKKLDKSTEDTVNKEQIDENTEVMEESADQSAKGKAPRLKDTKLFKSFETSFEGEDYIVVDLPSDNLESNLNENNDTTSDQPDGSCNKQESESVQQLNQVINTEIDEQLFEKIDSKRVEPIESEIKGSVHNTPGSIEIRSKETDVTNDIMGEIKSEKHLTGGDISESNAIDKHHMNVNNTCEDNETIKDKTVVCDIEATTVCESEEKAICDDAVNEKSISVMKTTEVENSDINFDGKKIESYESFSMELNQESGLEMKMGLEVSESSSQKTQIKDDVVQDKSMIPEDSNLPYKIAEDDQENKMEMNKDSDPNTGIDEAITEIMTLEPAGERCNQEGRSRNEIPEHSNKDANKGSQFIADVLNSEKQIYVPCSIPENMKHSDTETVQTILFNKDKQKHVSPHVKEEMKTSDEQANLYTSTNSDPAELSDSQENLVEYREIVNEAHDAETEIGTISSCTSNYTITNIETNNSVNTQTDDISEPNELQKKKFNSQTEENAHLEKSTENDEEKIVDKNDIGKHGDNSNSDKVEGGSEDIVSSEHQNIIVDINKDDKSKSDALDIVPKDITSNVTEAEQQGIVDVQNHERQVSDFNLCEAENMTKYCESTVEDQQKTIVDTLDVDKVKDSGTSGNESTEYQQIGIINSHDDGKHVHDANLGAVQKVPEYIKSIALEDQKAVEVHRDSGEAIDSNIGNIENAESNAFGGHEQEIVHKNDADDELNASIVKNEVKDVKSYLIEDFQKPVLEQDSDSCTDENVQKKIENNVVEEDQQAIVDAKQISDENAVTLEKVPEGIEINVVKDQLKENVDEDDNVIVHGEKETNDSVLGEIGNVNKDPKIVAMENQQRETVCFHDDEKQLYPSENLNIKENCIEKDKEILKQKGKVNNKVVVEDTQNVTLENYDKNNVDYGQNLAAENSSKQTSVDKEITHMNDFDNNTGLSEASNVEKNMIPLLEDTGLKQKESSSFVQQDENQKIESTDYDDYVIIGDEDTNTDIRKQVTECTDEEMESSESQVHFKQTHNTDSEVQYQVDVNEISITEEKKAVPVSDSDVEKHIVQEVNSNEIQYQASINDVLITEQNETVIVPDCAEKDMLQEAYSSEEQYRAGVNDVSTTDENKAVTIPSCVVEEKIKAQEENLSEIEIQSGDDKVSIIEQNEAVTVSDSDVEKHIVQEVNINEIQYQGSINDVLITEENETVIVPGSVMEENIKAQEANLIEIQNQGDVDNVSITEQNETVIVPDSAEKDMLQEAYSSEEQYRAGVNDVSTTDENKAVTIPSCVVEEKIKAQEANLIERQNQGDVDKVSTSEENEAITIPDSIEKDMLQEAYNSKEQYRAGVNDISTTEENKAVTIASCIAKETEGKTEAQKAKKANLSEIQNQSDVNKFSITEQNEAVTVSDGDKTQEAYKSEEQYKADVNVGSITEENEDVKITDNVAEICIKAKETYSNQVQHQADANEVSITEASEIAKFPDSVSEKDIMSQEFINNELDETVLREQTSIAKGDSKINDTKSKKKRKMKKSDAKEKDNTDPAVDLIDESETLSESLVDEGGSIDNMNKAGTHETQITKTYSSVVSTGVQKKQHSLDKSPSKSYHSEQLTSTNKSQSISAPIEQSTSSQTHFNQNIIKKSTKIKSETTTKGKPSSKQASTIPKQETLAASECNEEARLSHVSATEVTNLQDKEEHPNTEAKPLSKKAKQTKGTHHEQKDEMATEKPSKKNKQKQGPSKSKKKGGKRKNDQWKASSVDDADDQGETEQVEDVKTDNEDRTSLTRSFFDQTCCVLILLIVVFVILCVTLYSRLYTDNDLVHSEL